MTVEKLRPAKLQPAEVADLAARQDGSPPAEQRRARRHGGGELAQRAEATAQSRLFDDLAASAVQRRALLRAASTADALLQHDVLTDDLASYRSEGLIWSARSRD